MGVYYFSFIFFSLLPSAIWLIFFLQEDKHPEPGKMILKTFSWGAFASIPVILASFAINLGLLNLPLSGLAVKLIMIIAVAAITEELAKYFVIRQSVLKSSDCDEPIDLMIYAITAALGFAAMENLLFLFPESFPFSQKIMATESYFRFISGTFLHALTSGIMGYFIALSILFARKRIRLVFTGVFLAMLLHAAYNFSIIYSASEKYMVVAAPILLITLFIVVFLCFGKLRKTTSICLQNDGTKNK